MFKCLCQSQKSVLSSHCKPCSSAYFRDNFTHWSSGDSNVDEVIQNSQLNANHGQELIEWIEYSNLKNIKFVAHGGFGSVYKAVWKDGPIDSYGTRNDNKFELKRNSNREVAVKNFGMLLM